jgi:hypothetical protein
LQISRNELDRISGLADGHVAKIVSPQPAKKFGIISLGAILQSLGLILVIVEDPVARDRTLARRTPFDSANRRVGNKCRAGKPAQLESATPAVIAPPQAAHHRADFAISFARRPGPPPGCPLRRASLIFYFGCTLAEQPRP